MHGKYSLHSFQNKTQNKTTKFMSLQFSQAHPAIAPLIQQILGGDYSLLYLQPAEVLRFFPEIAKDFGLDTIEKRRKWSNFYNQIKRRYKKKIKDMNVNINGKGKSGGRNPQDNNSSNINMNNAASPGSPIGNVGSPSPGQRQVARLPTPRNSSSRRTSSVAPYSTGNGGFGTNVLLNSAFAQRPENAHFVVDMFKAQIELESKRDAYIERDHVAGEAYGQLYNGFESFQNRLYHQEQNRLYHREPAIGNANFNAGGDQARAPSPPEDIDSPPHGGDEGTSGRNGKNCLLLLSLLLYCLLFLFLSCMCLSTVQLMTNRLAIFVNYICLVDGEVSFSSGDSGNGLGITGNMDGGTNLQHQTNVSSNPSGGGPGQGINSTVVGGTNLQPEANVSSKVSSSNPSGSGPGGISSMGGGANNLGMGALFMSGPKRNAKWSTDAQGHRIAVRLSPSEMAANANDNAQPETNPAPAKNTTLGGTDNNNTSFNSGNGMGTSGMGTTFGGSGTSFSSSAPFSFGSSGSGTEAAGRSDGNLFSGGTNAPSCLAASGGSTFNFGGASNAAGSTFHFDSTGTNIALV